MQNNQAIFETIFNRNFSDTDNAAFLKEIAEKHPYFSPAQFFLLQNYEKGTEVFDRQALKTNILFNNPFWLNFQLNQEAEMEHIQTNEIIQVAETVTEDISGSPDDTDMAEETDMDAEPMKIELKIPATQTIPNEAMLFEPMHMVDYFASQGIKLTEEVQTADKLGKQLKSFTEWLKTMKKIHVEESNQPAGTTDTNIQSMAETSNTDADVLTEAMAEVLVKQGKQAKAEEVYQKLSLLNPAKSAYFAAKIENLKGS